MTGEPPVLRTARRTRAGRAALLEGPVLVSARSSFPLLPSAQASAAAGVRSGVALLDSAAQRVARDTARTSDLAQGLADPSPDAPGEGDDGLLGAVPDLLVARTLVAAQVFTARRAEDAYRSVLDLAG